MSFSHIVRKIFIANIRRYLLHLFAVSFTIAVFYSLIAFYTSSGFINAIEKNGVGQDNIYGPIVIAGLFAVFFIFFSYRSFIKSRKPEFGNYMVLGMTGFDVKMLIIIESAMMFLLSVAIGIGSGMLFSKLLAFTIGKILNIGSVPITYSAIGFKYTIGFFFLIFLLAVAVNLFTIGRYNIASLMKGARSGDRDRLDRPWIKISGLVLSVSSIVFAILCYSHNQGDPVIYSILACSLGIYLLLSYTPDVTTKIIKHFRKKRKDDMMFVSELRHSFGSLKNVIFSVMLLSATTVLFCVLCLWLVIDCDRMVAAYNPYDIAYLEYNDMHDSDNNLNRIINSGETELTYQNSVRVIINNTYSNTYCLVPQSDLNSISSDQFSVNPGHFIYLYEERKDSGYPYTEWDGSDIELLTDRSPVTLAFQDQVTEVVFNRIGIEYFILNDEDFDKLAGNTSNSISGQIHLLKFSNWKKTENIIQNLKDELNVLSRGKKCVVISRLEDHLSYSNIIYFTIVLFIYVSFLFFIASCIVLHLAFMTMIDREKVKHKKLYRIGITRGESRRIISKQLIIPIFLPVILALLLVTVFCLILLSFNDKRIMVLCITYIGATYIAFQTLFYAVYSRWYANMIFKAILVN